MPAEILIDRHGPLIRAARFMGGELTDLQVDNADRPSLAGAVLTGKVVRLVPGIGAVQVDIGGARPGLLAQADIRPRGATLKPGQPILIQVMADPRSGVHSHKGATLSMDIALAGRFLVAAPLARTVSVSRRLGRGPQIQPLTTLLADAPRIGLDGDQGGWIVRAAALTATPDNIQAEILALARQCRRLTDPGGAVGEIRVEPPNAAIRLLTEQSEPVAQIRVEGADILTPLRAWCAEQAPDLMPCIRPYTDAMPLADTVELDRRLWELSQPYVGLPGGGSLIIQPTEALTAVDVNSGDRGGDALAINLQAAHGLARQLRLRNIGGVVVVDFITLPRPEQRERLIHELTGAVADDPGSVHVYGISPLGLVELTRRRRGLSLHDALTGTDLLRDPQ